MPEPEAVAHAGPRPTFWQQTRLPLTALAEYPFPFIEWLLVAILIGSTGVWLVPLVIPDPTTVWLDSWYHSVASGHLAVFCIVLLAEMMPWGFPYAGGFGRRRVEPSRGAATMLALLLVVIQAACLIGLSRPSPNHQATLVVFQLVLCVPVTLTAIYLVCFRIRDMEPSVASIEARETEEVRRLDTKADSITTTRDGEKL